MITTVIALDEMRGLFELQWQQCNWIAVAPSKQLKGQSTFTKKIFSKCEAYFEAFSVLMLCALSNCRQPFSHDIGRVQTWWPGSVLGHGHQCECSILVVPVQKLEHGTRVRALSPKVVFRHRTRARALVCTRFHQCHVFYPCFPAIWSCGGETVDETMAIIDAYSEKMVLGTLYEQHSF